MFIIHSTPEYLHDGVTGDHMRQSGAAQLGEAGQQEHVRSLQQLRHRVITHVAVVTVHKVDHATEY